jgi:hypothetical protein
VALSYDGWLFTSMAVLQNERTEARYDSQAKTAGYQYPHLLEHDGNLYVTYAENKEDIVVLKVSHAELDRAAPRLP